MTTPPTGRCLPPRRGLDPSRTRGGQVHCRHERRHAPPVPAHVTASGPLTAARPHDTDKKTSTCTRGRKTGRERQSAATPPMCTVPQSAGSAHKNAAGRVQAVMRDKACRGGRAHAAARAARERPCPRGRTRQARKRRPRQKRRPEGLQRCWTAPCDARVVRARAGPLQRARKTPTDGAAALGGRARGLGCPRPVEEPPATAQHGGHRRGPEEERPRLADAAKALGGERLTAAWGAAAPVGRPRPIGSARSAGRGRVPVGLEAGDDGPTDEPDRRSRGPPSTTRPRPLPLHSQSPSQQTRVTPAPGQGGMARPQSPLLKAS